MWKKQVKSDGQVAVVSFTERVKWKFVDFHYKRLTWITLFGCIGILIGISITGIFYFTYTPPTNVKPCYLTYLGQWNQWSSCSVSCGSGVKRRRRTVKWSDDTSAECPTKDIKVPSEHAAKCSQQKCISQKKTDDDERSERFPAPNCSEASCYQVYRPAKTWSEASRNIRNLSNFGRRMAEIRSSAQQAALESALAKTNVKNESADKFWLNMVCNCYARCYTPSDKEVLEFTKWARNWAAVFIDYWKNVTVLKKSGVLDKCKMDFCIAVNAFGEWLLQNCDQQLPSIYVDSSIV